VGAKAIVKLFYTYEDLTNDLVSLCRQMAIADYKPEVIIGPGRGGFLPGVMLSHYYNVPFRGFNWQTRDGEFEDKHTLLHVLEKYGHSNILLIDDINDTGKTLTAIENVILDYAVSEVVDIQLKYATLFSKTTSEFNDVDFYVRELTPDNDPWVVFPYENWWESSN
jgi:hypoxanthine phosphoribosyltransferase